MIGLIVVLILPGIPFILKLTPNNPSPISLGIIIFPIKGILDKSLFRFFAKNLNKLLSKIPLIGNIIIPKEIGEGLFGVSFKMKGMPGKIKTTINPIKTLTPRFITKALEKTKKSK